MHRSVFIDLQELARSLSGLAPAHEVLEIGAGDGFLATALAVANPGMHYFGIDVAPRPGRLYAGPSGVATFQSLPLNELDPERMFDLVLLADVLHHVRPGERRDLLATAWSHVAPGGWLAVKEWERGKNIAHFLAYVSDRYISGDREVSFVTREELESQLAECLGPINPVVEVRIPPRRNNLLVVSRKPFAAS